jgi:NhaP-type Na+/H+ or K+/H+ antiporter
MHFYKSQNSADLTSVFTKLWRLVFLPLLFALIGNEVDFQKINLNLIGLGVALIAIGLVFRVIGTFFSVFYKSLTLKERFFFCLAWIPKATVQVSS